MQKYDHKNLEDLDYQKDEEDEEDVEDEITPEWVSVTKWRFDEISIINRAVNDGLANKVSKRKIALNNDKNAKKVDE